MKCPVCGADNQEGSRYCPKCLTNLTMATGEYNVATQPSPSEWRGTSAGTRREATDRKVQESSRHAMIEWGIYGGIVLILAILLLLSVTVWGNKSPSRVVGGFMQALNARDIEGMKQYVYAPGGEVGDARLQELVNRIGPDGAFVNLTYRTDEIDNYSAVVYLEGGVFYPGGTRLDIEIDPSRKLYTELENQNGHWYVDLARVNIFP